MSKIIAGTARSIDGYIAGLSEGGFEGTSVAHIAYAVRKDQS